MGQLEQAIKQAILGHTEVSQVKQIFTGTAKNVTNTTCNVERENAPALHSVRLNAIDDNLESYITVVPADGSNVIVGIIENLKTEAVVLRCSEVQKMIIKIGEHSLTIDKAGVIFNEGKDGLVKLPDLVTWMTKIYADLQTISGALKGLGVPIVISTDAPNKKMFEDTKIKH